MSEPFVGEVRCFPYNFAPSGWAFCDGRLLAISENATLFQLIGTIYGGDGQTTFALPDLRSRVPVHQGTDQNGNTYVIGQQGGTEQVTLTLSEIPAHSHVVSASTNTATLKRPTSGTLYAVSNNGNSFYATPTSPIPLVNSTVTLTGGSQPHSNIQPYLTFNWCISLFGIFPSQG